MSEQSTWQQQAKAALQQLPTPSRPLTKAEKFRQLLPDIERQIQAGTPQADIAAALSEAGMAMTTEMFRNYLAAARRQQRKTPANEASQTPAATTPPKAATAASKPDTTTARGDYRQQRGQPLKW
jgi:hypothetical protein